MNHCQGWGRAQICWYPPDRVSISKSHQQNIHSLPLQNKTIYFIVFPETPFEETCPSIFFFQRNLLIHMVTENYYVQILSVAIFSHVDLEWRKWSVKEEKQETFQKMKRQQRERESPDSIEYLVLIVSETEQNSGSVRQPYKLNYKQLCSLNNSISLFAGLTSTGFHYLQP